MGFFFFFFFLLLLYGLIWIFPADGLVEFPESATLGAIRDKIQTQDNTHTLTNTVYSIKYPSPTKKKVFLFAINK